MIATGYIATTTRVDARRRRAPWGRVPRGRVARASAPMALERSYGAALERLVVDPMIATTRAVLISALPSVVRDTPDQINPSRGDALRVDGYRDVIRALIERLGREIERSTPRSDLDREIAATSRATSAFNLDQQRRMFADFIRLDFGRAEPAVAEMVTVWARENASLITSMQSRYLEDVERLVVRAVTSGQRAEQIAAEIERRYLAKTGRNAAGKKTIRGVSYQARRIARDQINKLNGDISRVRQTAAGVTEYVWRTMRDSRVRPEHEEREGRVFSWSDPPEDGHPGEPVQCRCYAEPVLD